MQAQAIVGQARPPQYALRTRRGWADFYVYSIELNWETDVLRFDGDGDFELQRLTAFVANPDDDYTQYTSRIGSVNFNIRDNATGRLMFADYVNFAEVFGIGRTPFILPTTHWFRRATSAEVLYSPIAPGPDFDGPYRFNLGFIGRKHFDY